MPRFAYVNGRYVPHGEAVVHIEDRGYQFADGVYEVVTIANGQMVDEGPHLDRLERSLGEISIPMPMSRRALRLVMRELVSRNAVRSEEHTSELQSLMRISYAAFCLKKNTHANP